MKECIGKFSIILVLDNIRSLQNIGAMFRTAEAANISKIYLTGICGKPPRKEISKAALGAEKFVEWEYFKSVEDLVFKLKNEGYFIVAAELTKKSVNFKKAVYNFPLVLVLGHEKDGVSKKILDLADLIVEIPMLGVHAKSLNVATSCGIIVYEIVERTKN
jgi:tRNA G18 (ribose-2'-O)-methylase SpoU